MGGGLLQLAAYGAENIYLNGNPQMTHFKNIHKRSTHFSMETFEAVLDGPAQLNYRKPTRYKFKIPRHGDLVYHTYLKFNLPS